MVAVPLAGPRELGVCAIARLRGWSRWTVARWLRSLEAKYGERVVYRRGTRLYTTDIALALLLPPALDRRTEARLRDLEERTHESERRLDAFEREQLVILQIVRTPKGASAQLKKA